jgi:5-methylcytosine-specific restriction endonuclease McrA
MLNIKKTKYYYSFKKLSLRKTALKLGIDVTTLRYNMKKHKIPIRSVKESMDFLDKSGKNNAMWGKKGKNHPAYKHGGISYCIDCGKRISYKAKRCHKCYGKYLSIKYQREGHPNWQGGKSFEPYYSNWTETLRDSIRQRDNHKCQCCGMTQEEHLEKYNDKLNVHHIDYNKNNCEESNLITLCYKCHSKSNFNRDYWYSYYIYIMENNYEKIR